AIIMNPIVTKGISLALETIGKSQLVKEGVDKIESGLDHLDAMHRIEPISIEALAESLSPAIDQQIVEISRNESVKPLGGDLKANYINNSIQLHLKRYFNDRNNKVILKESKKIVDKTYLDQDSINNIKASELVYPITPPTGG